MPHRMDVELTSDRGDGTWTWRAAGAKQPKGVLDGAVLYEGARVGDVVRVEAAFDVDGISILSTTAPKEKKRPEPERLEILGPPPPPARPPASRQAGGAERAAPRRPRRDGAEPGRAPSEGRTPREGRTRKDGRTPREGRTPTEGRTARPGRAPHTGRDRSDERRRDHADGRSPAARDAAGPPKPRARRLTPGNTHRAAALAALPVEQRPVAEQVLRGGIPAVRQAVEVQNAERRQRGEPEVKAEALMALAEELLPVLKSAEWRDRAEAAAKAPDEVAIRDLRSVVAGADAAARDDEARLLASTLRETLQRRLSEQRQRWIDDITAALDEGRLVRALRLSARPPDSASRFPAQLALRLSEAAGQAMCPDASPERWSTLLEAVAESPVRRTVKPSGLPAEPGEELLVSARQACGRVPSLAGLLGIDMPPPPGRPRRPQSS